MKSISILLGLMFIFHLAKSQETPPEEYIAVQAPKIYTRNFIGIGTGINSNVGLLGANVEIGIGKQFSLGAGAGLSTWGRKLHGEFKYYFKPDLLSGWALGLGVTHSSGIKNFAVDMEVQPDNATKPVKMDLLPQTGYCLSLYKYWRVGKTEKNKFFMQTGIAGRFDDSRIYKMLDQEKITKNSEAILEVLAPGGLILAMGFSFGL